jgi:hypothetical protein
VTVPPSKQGAQDSHGGGFAGAVRPQQGQHGAALYLQVDAFEDRGLAVRLGQVLDFNHVFGGYLDAH